MPDLPVNLIVTHRNRTMPSYGPLCAEFYDHDKPFAPADAVRYYAGRGMASGGPILEPMCGSGRYLIPILGSGVEVEGVDAAPAMLEACRRNASRQRLQPVLYQQSIASLSLPRRYRMAFVPSGSIGLLQADDFRSSLRALRRHLDAGAPLLLELVRFDDGDDLERDLEPRVVQIDADTRIVYNCRAKLSVDRASIQFDGRYEKCRNGHVVEIESESIVLWKYDPSTVLASLRACGYSRAQIVESNSHAWLGESDCYLVEAFADA
jgi:SAM-dependent methyltransferase